MMREWARHCGDRKALLYRHAGTHTHCLVRRRWQKDDGTTLGWDDVANERTHTHTHTHKHGRLRRLDWTAAVAGS